MCGWLGKVSLGKGLKEVRIPVEAKPLLTSGTLPPKFRG